MLLKSVLSTFIIFTITLPALAQQSVKHISSYQTPEPLKRVAPTYPISAARENREGWTKMSFIIEKDGSVTNPIVIESSGSRDFDQKSLSAIKQWKYSPAIENGQPIQQCINTVQLDFKMSDGGAKGVTRRFRTRYLSAVEALQQKDYKTVEEDLAQLNKIKNMHLTESNLYHNLAANYAKDIGNTELELKHLNLVSTHHSSMSPENIYNILARSFFIQIKRNQLSSAIGTYNQIKEIPAAKPYLANFEKVIDQIDSVITSEQNIVVKGNISERNLWFYQLVRNEFSITNIKGSLHKIDVRCANKHHVYTIEDNHTWTIPAAWQHCSLMIFGDSQTNFDLIEHPIKS